MPPRLPLLRSSPPITPRLLRIHKMSYLYLSTGASHPTLLYGTAWKEEQTAYLVSKALNAGFRGIDTACQPKHYREDLVGAGIHSFLNNRGSELGITRQDLFIQTKFTGLQGQDIKRTPYRVDAPLEEQIQDSVQASLKNLHVSYLDSLVLHSPLETWEETLKAWKVLEAMVPDTIRYLGISNVDVETLEHLRSSPEVSVKPSVVQNRFYARTGYDKEIREICRQEGWVYQAFWTLTANPGLLKSSVVTKIAGEKGWSRAEALYALILSLARGWEKGGIAVLDGTKNEGRLRGDLKVAEEAEEVEGLVDEFKALLGE
ncbi:hypothetical protein RUND412_009118 [Rhizina undulata]